MLSCTFRFQEVLDDCIYIWYATRASHEDVWPKFKAFYEKNGHLRIPYNEPDIGTVAICIRSLEYFWNTPILRSGWTIAISYTTRVVRISTKMCGPSLSHLWEKASRPKMSRILATLLTAYDRSKLLHYTDFKQWLDDRNFSYDARRAHLDEEGQSSRHSTRRMGIYKFHNEPDIEKSASNIRSSRRCFLNYLISRSG